MQLPRENQDPLLPQPSNASSAFPGHSKQSPHLVSPRRSPPRHRAGPPPRSQRAGWCRFLRRELPNFAPLRTQRLPNLKKTPRTTETTGSSCGDSKSFVETVAQNENAESAENRSPPALPNWPAASLPRGLWKRYSRRG